MNVFSLCRRILHAHPRLFVALGAGLINFAVMPGHMSILLKSMVSWNVLTWIYIMLLWNLMLRADTNRIRLIAHRQDENAATVLVLVCIACVASLGVIFLDLSAAKELKGFARAVRLGLSSMTLLASWLLVPTAFAIHYAHLFYRNPPTENKALIFPNGMSEPGYWDFLYFSFTISVASQTADVSIGNTPMRKAVLLQSVLSFIFNISILGLFVNVTASLTG